MSTTQAEELSDSDSGPSSRPIVTFKQGGVEVSVWKNHTAHGDLFNTTIRNSYKDDRSGEWRETKSFSPTDLAVLVQLSGQAFQAIGELKSHNRIR